MSAPQLGQLPGAVALTTTVPQSKHSYVDSSLGSSLTSFMVGTTSGSGKLSPCMNNNRDTRFNVSVR